MSRPRVVLDTNCLVSALVFARGELARLRAGWQENRFTPLVCAETTAELIRVLAYPKFRLDEDEINALLADFLPYAETVVLPRRRREVAGLRDAEDAVFVQLAQWAKADWLVSGDRHLAELKEQLTDVRVVTPAEFLRQLGTPGQPVE